MHKSGPESKAANYLHLSSITERQRAIGEITGCTISQTHFTVDEVATTH